MNKFAHVLTVALCGAVLSASCGRREASPEPVTRLDLQLRDEALPADSALAAGWFKIAGLGEMTDSARAAYRVSRSVTPFFPAIDSVWTPGRVDALEQEIGMAYGLLGEKLPALTLPRPVAIVSPFNQSVILADSVAYIGLNHYLGTDYEFYGYFPDWIRKDKIPARVVPNLVEAVIRREYPAPQEPENVLAAMMYEGALIEAMVRVCGEEALPWDKESLDYLSANERRIWEKMLKDRLVFSTDGAVMRSLLAPGAWSSVVAPDVPGRAGAYIGWQIVRSRLSHKKVGLPEMLSDEWIASPDALKEADYRP